MQINLEEILGGDATSKEPSHKSFGSASKSHNNRIVLTNQSYYSEEGEDRHSMLRLNDNIFNMESPQDDEGGQQSSINVEGSLASMKNDGKMPGERLFYQSQAIKMRRQKEQEVKRRQEREKEEGLFQPKINPQSKQLKSKYTSGQYKPQQLKKVVEMREKEHQRVEKEKEKEEIKKCTFKPAISTKTQQLTKHRSTPAFQYLYHSSKTQQIKKELRAMEANEAIKHQTKPKAEVEKAFEDFLQRSEMFMEKHRNKLQLLNTKINSYSEEGEKLFTPKISGRPLGRMTSPKKGSPSLKDLNQMLLNRIKKFQPVEELQQEKEGSH